MRTALPVLMIALLSASCGRTPESAGAELADARCACEHKKIDLGLKMMDEIGGMVKDGDFKDRFSFQSKMLEVQQEMMKELKTCEDECDKIESSIEQEFMRDEDRDTARNARIAGMDKCQEGLKEEQAKAQDEAREWQQEMEGLLKDFGGL